MTPPDLAFRVAAVLLWVTGIGFGWFCIPAMRSLRAGRGVPIVFGFPAHGGGVFERFGIKTTIHLLAAFLTVCLLELVAGGLVWNGRIAGAILGLALLPLGAVFWVGFSLPIPPILALVRTILIVANRGKLS